MAKKPVAVKRRGKVESTWEGKMGSRVTEGGGGRRIKRAAMGWMISPCLQGYTLQLYHCRAGQW